MTKANLLKAIKFTADNFYLFSKNLEKQKMIGAAEAIKIAYEELYHIIENEKYCKYLAEMQDKLTPLDPERH